MVSDGLARKRELGGDLGCRSAALEGSEDLPLAWRQLREVGRRRAVVLLHGDAEDPDDMSPVVECDRMHLDRHSAAARSADDAGSLRAALASQHHLGDVAERLVNILRSDERGERAAAQIAHDLDCARVQPADDTLRTFRTCLARFFEPEEVGDAESSEDRP
jgi:hypothetical protein